MQPFPRAPFPDYDGYLFTDDADPSYTTFLDSNLDTPRQLAWLNQLYTDLLRPYNNCFQPVMKLVKKESVGQRTRKVYDRPTTPLERVLLSGKIDATKVRALTDLYTRVSPLTLKRQIDRWLASLPVALEVTSIA